MGSALSRASHTSGKKGQQQGEGTDAKRDKHAGRAPPPINTALGMVQNLRHQCDGSGQAGGETASTEQVMSVQPLAGRWAVCAVATQGPATGKQGGGRAS